MDCKIYAERLEESIRHEQKEEMFRHESALLEKNIRDKLDGPTEKMVLAGYTFIAESQTAAKWLREKLARGNA
jgi:hypothetical protein